jgi:hypothetical protein
MAERKTRENGGPGEMHPPEPTRLKFRIRVPLDFLKSHKVSSFLQDPKTWFEILALIVVVWYTYYSARQVEATRVANQIAISAFSATQRPWIGFERHGGIDSDPLRIDEEGRIYTSVTSRPKNFGNYPGLINGCVFATLVVSDTAHAAETVNNQLNKLMKARQPNGIGPSLVIFPGADMACFNGTFVSRESMASSGFDLSKLVAFLVGGIVYADPFGNVRHTGFSYQYQTPTVMPQLVTFELKHGAVVPPGSWIVYKTLVDATPSVAPE